MVNPGSIFMSSLSEQHAALRIRRPAPPTLHVTMGLGKDSTSPNPKSADGQTLKVVSIEYVLSIFSPKGGIFASPPNLQTCAQSPTICASPSHLLLPSPLPIPPSSSISALTKNPISERLDQSFAPLSYCHWQPHTEFAAGDLAPIEDHQTRSRSQCRS